MQIERKTFQIIHVLSLFAASLFAAPAYAAPAVPAVMPTPVPQATLSVMSKDAIRLNDIVYSAQAIPQPPTNSKLTIKLMVNCFGTNVRTVASPLSPSSFVQFQTTILGQGVAVAFPARFTDNSVSTEIAGPGQVIVTNPANVLGIPDVSKNTIRIQTQNIDVQTWALGVSTNGDYSAALRNVAIKHLSFRQDIYAAAVASNTPQGWLLDEPFTAPTRPRQVAKWIGGLGRLLVNFMPSRSAYAGGGDGGDGGSAANLPDAANPAVTDGGFAAGQCAGCKQPPPTPEARAQSSQYAGTDGSLSSQYTLAWSADLTLLEIHAAFPGQPGFCGGFRARPSPGPVWQLRGTRW